MNSATECLQSIVKFLLEKEEHIIMMGTRLPDLAISARGLTASHRRELKADASFLLNECLLPILKIFEKKS